MLNRYKWTCSARQRQHWGEPSEGEGGGSSSPSRWEKFSICFVLSLECLNASWKKKSSRRGRDWDRQKDMWNQTAHLGTESHRRGLAFLLNLDNVPFVLARFESEPLVYETNCLVMQVSCEASLFSPGAKFNKPLDSWPFCFKIWGQRFWPVNHQLSALPSKIKKKKSNDSCLVWSIPVSQLLLHSSAFQKGSGRSPAQQGSSSASTQVKFIYIWKYPPKSVSVFLLRSNAPAAVTGITGDTYLFRINSQSAQLGT